MLRSVSRVLRVAAECFLSRIVSECCEVSVS